MRFSVLLLPLALAACNPEDVSKMMDDASSSVAHSTVVIDLEAGGDAMMAKDESAGSSADAMMEKDASDGAMMDKEGAMDASTSAPAASSKAAAVTATAGAYLAFNTDVLKDGQTKVLFFHAAWCPICRAQDTELISWYGNKDGLLSTYKVDYDSEKALKAVYGVTYQHTFVKVDGQGKLISKIQGPTDEQLTALLTL